jgi:hypothetical protein
MPQVSRWKKYAVQFGITAATVLLQQTVLGQQPVSLPGEIPAGWYVYPERKLKNLDETTLRCFNYSHNKWQVTNEENAVRITPRPNPSGKDDLPPVPSWPALLKRQERRWKQDEAHS